MQIVPDGLLGEFKNKNYNFVFKAKKKQVLLIGVKGEIYAIDNRCPHEGYPLSKGFTNDNCILTCNWHNWKFNLRTGECLFGEDNVRNYPINIENGKPEGRYRASRSGIIALQSYKRLKNDLQAV